jgi:hypothetical protein
MMDDVPAEGSERQPEARFGAPRQQGTGKSRLGQSAKGHAVAVRDGSKY